MDEENYYWDGSIRPIYFCYGICLSFIDAKAGLHSNNMEDI